MKQLKGQIAWLNVLSIIETYDLFDGFSHTYREVISSSHHSLLCANIYIKAFVLIYELFYSDHKWYPRHSERFFGHLPRASWYQNVWLRKISNIIYVLTWIWAIYIICTSGKGCENTIETYRNVQRLITCAGHSLHIIPTILAIMTELLATLLIPFFHNFLHIDRWCFNNWRYGPDKEMAALVGIGDGIVGVEARHSWYYN